MAAAAGPIIEALLASGALSGSSSSGGTSEGVGLQGLMGGSAGGSTGGVAGLNVSLGLLDKGAGKLTNIFGELNKTMTQMEAPVKQMEAFFDHIAEYVGKFSPAHAQYFGRAVADFQAAIGETLVPVLEFGTKLFREMGDAFATSGGRLRNLFKSLVSAFDDVYEAVKPVLVMMVEAFNLLIEVITVAVRAMKPYLELMKEASALFFGKKDFSQSAGGKAAISVGTDSVEGLLTKTQQNAFSVGGSSPEVESAGYLKEIAAYFLEGKFIDQFEEAIANLVKDGSPANVVERGGDWIQDKITRSFTQ